ncbi:hypothetical protein IMCC3135_15850 [Granulosicoccus antarcticus IMCC3135]|uniref:Uncharacterized protein n=1 Tax=Granulosicoccus antarcticus IMCC3135 TaxID=1192854 RepID=A0A2Z2NP44_9GAMM|nr:hypothetical protein IMCC3135_15850 [Granulosicoccus antarcticus IMCC3135]
MQVERLKGNISNNVDINVDIGVLAGIDFRIVPRY